MKKVIISEKCVSCGACALECDVFEESPNGKAAINNKIELDDNITKKILKIANECPVKAIEIIEDKIVKSQGKEGLKEVSNLLKKELIDSQIAKPQIDDYKFNKEEYRIPVSAGYGEYRYDYKSDDKAVQAGLKEFDRVMYSQRKALIQQVLVEYKFKSLKKYSEYEMKDGNYYYDLKKKIEQILIKVEREAKSISNNKISLPNNFSIFEVKPDFGHDDMIVYQLRHFEELWFTNDIMNELESLHWYDTYVDTDDMEDSRGKDVYCYKNIYKVSELFGKHILDEVVYVLSGADGAQKIVNEALNKYIDLANKEINKKVEIFYNAIKNSGLINENYKVNKEKNYSDEKKITVAAREKDEVDVNPKLDKREEFTWTTNLNVCPKTAMDYACLVSAANSTIIKEVALPMSSDFEECDKWLRDNVANSIILSMIALYRDLKKELEHREIGLSDDYIQNWIRENANSIKLASDYRRDLESVIRELIKLGDVMTVETREEFTGTTNLDVNPKTLMDYACLVSAANYTSIIEKELPDDNIESYKKWLKDNVGNSIILSMMELYKEINKELDNRKIRISDSIIQDWIKENANSIKLATNYRGNLDLVIKEITK
ncbi:ferredoxin [Clostridium sp. C2-6-12]|uniref:ferredoxin n=1 Tax=Clostridium sp. C2-6-12 TaxID=2698832 RepID=UPI00136ABAFC|nr:ferredoxin [Clostridium sp. C2-6-12]